MLIIENTIPSWDSKRGEAGGGSASDTAVGLTG